MIWKVGNSKRTDTTEGPEKKASRAQYQLPDANTLSPGRGSQPQRLKPGLTGWEYRKANVRWVWVEKTSWTAEITRLLSRLIWEIMNSMSSEFYKARPGAFQKTRKCCTQGLSGPTGIYGEKLHTERQKRASFTKLVEPSDSLFSRQKQLSSRPVTLLCRTGETSPPPDNRPTLRPQGSSPLPQAGHALGSVAPRTSWRVVNMPQGRPWLSRQSSHFSIPFILAFSFQKENVSDTSMYMKRLCKLLPFHSYNH